jgi:Galactose oxidase, central domain
MEFNWVRYFSRGFVILICYCGAIAFGSAASIGVPYSASWIQLSPANSPPARSYLAMTYDPASGNIIMFGGFDGAGYLNDTWTFDGVTWTQVAVSHSPPVRAAAQMAYDSVTRKVVLFGGYNGTNYLGDTWLWDGTTSRWTHARTAHHPRRVTGPMLFPDPNGRVDLFGGFDGHFYQLTMWQWTGSDWTQLFPATVPFARSSAGVATNPTIDQVVLFGGLADVNPNNTWTYDGTTWTLKSPLNQPLLVYAASAAFDPNINAVILFGGGSGGVDQNTTWQWFVAGGNWNWEQVATAQSPPPREGAGMAYLPALGRVIVFGGQDSETPLDDTWQFVP